MRMSAFHPLRPFTFGGSIVDMTQAFVRAAGRFWRALRFVVVDGTVTPRMLALNEQRPIVYQLVTTPVVTLVFGLIVGALIVGSSFLGIWPSR
jgi:hypothetical protein